MSPHTPLIPALPPSTTPDLAPVRWGTGIGAVAGGLAGGFTNATLHPIDTVKTKLQTKGSSTLYKGPIDVVKKVSKASPVSLCTFTALLPNIFMYILFTYTPTFGYWLPSSH